MSDRTFERLLDHLLGASLALLFVSAMTMCGCGMTANQRALGVALTTVESAHHTLLAYDHAHELELVDAAKDKSSANAALLGWHQTRDKVAAALVAAYEAIAIAETADTDGAVAAAVRAASDLLPLLRQLGVTP